MSSILTDIKLLLGLLEDDESFDDQVVMHINSSLAILTQLGVGPVEGFQITDKTQEWDAFEADPRLSSIRTYVYLRTKLEFDPPKSGFATASLERQLEMFECRINVVVDYG